MQNHIEIASVLASCMSLRLLLKKAPVRIQLKIGNWNIHVAKSKQRNKRHKKE